MQGTPVSCFPNCCFPNCTFKGVFRLLEPDLITGTSRYLCSDHSRLREAVERAFSLAVQEFHALALICPDYVKRIRPSDLQASESSTGVWAQLERARFRVNYLRDLLQKCGVL